MPELAADRFALHCVGVSKSFRMNCALDGANLAVAAGSIHALVGENGAGKSTLMNIVSGLLRPDAGTVAVFGKVVRFGSPLEAVAAGIGMVHQHFLLAEALTVAENIALGRRASPWGLRFDERRHVSEISRLSAETGLSVDPRARIADLAVGDRQRVEILKALARGARILLLDEPTAVLAPPEVDALFVTLRKLRSAGRTIVVITHKLDEVFALAEEVTVLRRGKPVFTGALSGLTPRTLAQKMVGDEHPIEPPTAATPGAVLLDVKALAATGARGAGLKTATFVLREGEILGIAGVEGNGQDELAGALSGTLVPEAASRVTLCGVALLGHSIRARSGLGLAVIPADRQREGLVLELTLAENLILRAAFERFKRCGGGIFLSRRAIRAQAVAYLREYEVVPADAALPAGALSGGNQQKVVIARELTRNPCVILACHPTRGLDVGAAASVHRRLLDAARRQRSGILLISSDLDEVLHLSDRIAVLYRGTLTELGARGVSKDLVGRAMVGV